MRRFSPASPPALPPPWTSRVVRCVLLGGGDPLLQQGLVLGPAKTPPGHDFLDIEYGRHRRGRADHRTPTIVEHPLVVLLDRPAYLGLTGLGDQCPGTDRKSVG